jgi:hypothetical protein
MATRTIRSQEALETVWSELVYTESRASADRYASDLAAPITALVAQVEELRRQQLGEWRAVIAAQAQVDAVSEELDELVSDFVDTLLFTLRDRKSPRFVRYFGSRTPLEITRLGLSSELEEVRGWPDSMQSEPEEALRAFAPKLEALVEQGEVALHKRTVASAARADFRVRSIEPFVEKVNAQRLLLLAELFKRAEEKKLPRSWAESFFRVQVKAGRRAETAPAPPAS